MMHALTLLALRGGGGVKFPEKNRYVTLEWSVLWINIGRRGCIVFSSVQMPMTEARFLLMPLTGSQAPDAPTVPAV